MPIRQTAQRIRIAGCALALLTGLSLLTACATARGGDAGPAAPAEPAATLPTVDAPADERLHCGDADFDADALRTPTALTDADDSVREALRSAGDEAALAAVAGTEHAWAVVSADDERISLLRLREEAPKGSAGYEAVTLRHDGAGWSYGSGGPCTLRVDQGERNEATVALDPEQLPQPDDTAVQLLVTELACHGGEDAAGRVEVVSLTETDTTVEVVIAVRPDTSADAWTCQSNPATPFTLELDEPLGDRVLVDASVIPAQPIAAGGRVTAP